MLYVNLIAEYKIHVIKFFLVNKKPWIEYFQEDSVVYFTITYSEGFKHMESKGERNGGSDTLVIMTRKLVRHYVTFKI